MTTQIETLGNNILFQFVEDVTNTRFINSNTLGIIIAPSDGNQANVPRWGRVTHLGPDVVDVKIDDYILVEAGMWTTGFFVDEVRYWKTDEDKVLAVSDEPTTTY